MDLSGCPAAGSAEHQKLMKAHFGEKPTVHGGRPDSRLAENKNVDISFATRSFSNNFAAN
jgi:hypothetical protein